MILRRFTSEDVQLLFELDNDAAVMRYINNGQPVDRAEVVEALDWWLGYYERYEGYGFWAAIDKSIGSQGEFLGWFHFRPGEGAGPLEPELGFRLHRAAWGRGLATEGSRALIDRGFEQLGVERVTAETMAVNIASRRVMEKAGLRLIRSFHADWPVRIPGDEFGDVEYAIDRSTVARRANSMTRCILYVASSGWAGVAMFSLSRACSWRRVRRAVAGRKRPTRSPTRRFPGRVPMVRPKLLPRSTSPRSPPPLGPRCRDCSIRPTRRSPTIRRCGPAPSTTGCATTSARTTTRAARPISGWRSRPARSTSSADRPALRTSSNTCCSTAPRSFPRTN